MLVATLRCRKKHVLKKGNRGCCFFQWTNSVNSMIHTKKKCNSLTQTAVSQLAVAALGQRWSAHSPGIVTFGSVELRASPLARFQCTSSREENMSLQLGNTQKRALLELSVRIAAVANQPQQGARRQTRQSPTATGALSNVRLTPWTACENVFVVSQ